MKTFVKQLREFRGSQQPQQLQITILQNNVPNNQTARGGGGKEMLVSPMAQEAQPLMEMSEVNSKEEMECSHPLYMKVNVEGLFGFPMNQDSQDSNKVPAVHSKEGIQGNFSDRTT